MTHWGPQEPGRKPRARRTALRLPLLFAICVMCAALPASAGEPEDKPLLFLGNHALPPMNFLKDGEPAGLVVDIARGDGLTHAASGGDTPDRLGQAQQLVLEGKGDALLQINPNPERMKALDFSAPLLRSEFTIFTAFHRQDITAMRDLQGLRLGVEPRGMAVSLLRDEPRIAVEPIPNYESAFRWFVSKPAWTATSPSLWMRANSCAPWRE